LRNGIANLQSDFPLLAAKSVKPFTPTVEAFIGGNAQIKVDMPIFPQARRSRFSQDCLNLHGF